MQFKVVFFLLIFSVNLIYSQNSADSIVVSRALDSTIDFYLQNLGEDALLYNGREYTGNYARTIGHPFYASDQPQKGSILYDQVLYPHSAISYDLTSDEIVIKTRQNRSLKLLSEKIDQFSIGDHLFVHLKNEMAENNGLIPGFYEILSNEEPKLLVKRKKQLIPSFNLEDPYRFVDYHRYFLQRVDRYVEITNEASLLSAFPGYKKEIKRYMRSQRLKFKTNTEQTIISVAKHFGRLKKQ
jgi:hypothetical protein